MSNCESKNRGLLISRLAEVTENSPLKGSLQRTNCEEELRAMICSYKENLSSEDTIDGERCVYLGFVEERLFPPVEEIINGMKIGVKRGPAKVLEPYGDPWICNEDAYGQKVVGVYILGINGIQKLIDKFPPRKN